MCVCVSIPKLLITSGMKSPSYGWLNEFFSFYMAAMVITFSWCGFTIKARQRKLSDVTFTLGAI